MYIYIYIYYYIYTNVKYTLHVYKRINLKKAKETRIKIYDHKSSISNHA